MGSTGFFLEIDFSHEQNIKNMVQVSAVIMH